MQTDRLIVESQNDILELDARTMVLLSFRARNEPEQEFISEWRRPIAFVIGYLDEQRQYRWLYSDEAGSIQVNYEHKDGASNVSAEYSGFANLDLRVTCLLRASTDDRFVHWSVRVVNHANIAIVDVQYPFIVCRFDLHGTPGTESIVLPHGYGSGRLIQNAGNSFFDGSAWAQKLRPDSWREWEFCSRMGDANHYPGMQFAQFLAYYNDRAGLYLACTDNAANLKRFAVLHHDPGIRLGVAHAGDWPANGERTLEYDTVTGSFTGDWYDAADLYREWTSQQKWFVPLTQRQDIPSWLIDSPVYVTVRPQGLLDAGPVSTMEEFVPYDRCLALLDSVAQHVQSPLAVILMGWERAGSWVYPDSFPPVGGESGMREFITALRDRGWRAGSFCNGTRWVIGQSWNNYDGRDYYDQHHGSESVCKEADGTAWHENWDVNWRPSYACCLGAVKTRQVAREFIGRLIDWGMQSIQFLDQNNGSSTFPCFSSQHEHPPMPGRWMAEKMAQFMNEVHQLARDTGHADVVHSAESGLNEVCLPLFQETELRIYPPGYDVDNIPLYQYLFHECVVLQGMMGNAPEPYHLALRNAANCVLGGIPGGVLTGYGTLLDKDTNNWAPWDPKIENGENAFEMIRTVAQLRRGPGRDFLVYGRMLRPANVKGVNVIEWSYDGRSHRIPAVFHSAWQAPDGRIGIILANWTTDSQTVSIEDLQSKTRSADQVTLHHSARHMTSTALQPMDAVELTLAPLACILLEIGKADRPQP